MSEADFIEAVLRNPGNARVLAALRQAALPDAWLVAGCLFQTVWNLRAGRAPQDGIADYDLFYFDAQDLSAEAEAQAQRGLEALLAQDGGAPLPLELKNQARVHLWYEAWFGQPYAPLGNAREGLERFLMPCCSVGLQPTASGLRLHAPFGLSDLEHGLLRPNPRMRQPTLFAAKAASYQARWPGLRIEATVAAETMPP